jgi:CheY-like chemotaxis protein
MVNLAIPTSYDEKQILVADDEREHVEFLLDYLAAKGFRITFAENARDALAASEKVRYRAYFIDLNIPFANPALDPRTNPTFTEYPGLLIIQAVRSQGNSGARVVAYSAHYNDQISSEIERLYCKYIVKGRAKDLKDAIDEILRVDPLQVGSS